MNDDCFTQWMCPVKGKKKHKILRAFFIERGKRQSYAEILKIFTEGVEEFFSGGEGGGRDSNGY